MIVLHVFQELFEIGIPTGITFHTCFCDIFQQKSDLSQHIKIFAGFFEPPHDQSNCASANFVSATAIIIEYDTLTHIYDSKNCSIVLHNCMLSHLFLPRENYTTINLTSMFQAGTPVEQCAHTVSNKIFTPVGRNLHKSPL